MSRPNRDAPTTEGSSDDRIGRFTSDETLVVYDRENPRAWLQAETTRDLEAMR